MDIYEIVTTLIGPIEPVGDTRIDDRRFENLKAFTMLVDNLLNDVVRIAGNADRHEYSVARAGKHCVSFLADAHRATEGDG